MKRLREKIDKLHDRIIDSEADLNEKLILDKKGNSLDFESIFTTCSLNETTLELGEDNLFGLNYSYDDTESIIIVYAISHSETNKRVTEKMMNLIAVLEDKYIVLDETIVTKKNSVTYLLIVKNLTDNNSQGEDEICP